ncbi:hypothetical protein QQX98_001409 [Neonectria punicea]|uniref:Uncharacterized protein n=1 Tax=Neonectria punicea TaxID=979145 RepID=A0ABR1HNN4_9HYPO
MDNHLLIDPVVAVIPDRSDEHHELRRMIRTPIFEKLGKQAQEGHVILMTACLVEDSKWDTALLQEHLDMACRADVTIFWVNVYWTKAKLTNVRVLRDLLHEHHLIEPRKSDDGETTLVVETLDVSGPVELSVSRLISMIGFHSVQSM